MNPAYWIGMLGSVLYGSSDYCGGLGARRASPWVVAFFSGLGGLAILLAGLPFFPGAPQGADLAWGVAAGACGALGGALIYRAIAIGPVSVASPVLALTGLVVPVVVGLALGDRPSPLALVGLALAPVSIALVTRAPGPDGGEGDGHAAPGAGASGHAPGASAVRRGLIAGLLAGSVIGFFLVLVSRIEREAGLLPLVVARLTALALYLAWFSAARMPLLPPRGARAIAIYTGVLDSLANVSFMWAVQRGSLALVSALVSLAPATTVLLARVHLRERWSAAQVAGLIAALAAGALISAG